MAGRKKASTAADKATSGAETTTTTPALTKGDLDAMTQTSEKFNSFGLTEAEEQLAMEEPAVKEMRPDFDLSSALTPLQSEDYDRLRATALNNQRNGTPPEDIMADLLTKLIELEHTQRAEVAALRQKLEARERELVTIKHRQDMWENSVEGTIDARNLVYGILTKTGTRRLPSDPLLCMKADAANRLKGLPDTVRSLLLTLQGPGSKEEYVAEFHRAADAVKKSRETEQKPGGL